MNGTNALAYLDNAWDKALQGFSKFIDYSSLRSEQQLALAQQQANYDIQRAQLPRQTNWGGSSSLVPVLLIGALVVGGGLLLLRK